MQVQLTGLSYATCNLFYTYTALEQGISHGKNLKAFQSLWEDTKNVTSNLH